MANEEHLAILKQGVDVWNAWREENYGIEPDLRGANLREAALFEADLIRANLRGADLGGANLSGANLREANLRGANLFRADLFRANLINADLRGANLINADLSHANLLIADLSHANLSRTILYSTIFNESYLLGTVFEDAEMGDAYLSSVDLSNAKGLRKVKHTSPSPISMDTIFRSQGKIPEVFLQGCDLSDWQIEFAKLAKPGLSPGEATQIGYDMINLYNGQGLQFYSCFISYNSQDQKFAQKLHDDLQCNSVRCWFAPEDIKGGRKIHPQIDEAIRLQDKLIVILSEHSMKSDWVAHELKLTRKREKELGRQMLFPIRLVDYEILQDWELFDADTVTDLASEVRQYFIPDFSEWENPASYKVAFERLLRDLKATSGEQ